MGQIVTFYSYKGGVGRSMSLANVGVLLAQWGYRVLMVDFDLEAPGLESFFSTLLDVESARGKLGVIDTLLQARDIANGDELPIDTVPVKLPRTDGELAIWNAGRRDSEYFKRVRKLDFRDFYRSANGGALIEKLRKQLKARYDFVLVDSRTGLTEIGGLCTVQLPDLIVLIFTATEQALSGGLDVVSRAADARQRLPYQRAQVPVLPLPSRVSFESEFRLSQKWLDRFERELTPLYFTWLPRSVRPRTFLELLKLPQIPYFSYGESLPVLEQGTTDPTGLGYAYENLAALIATGLQDVDTFVKSRDEYTKKAARGRREPAARGAQRKIFISYSHEDLRWMALLEKHLSVLERSRNLEIARGATALDFVSNINTADVIVLLVSASFLASAFARAEQTQDLLKAAQDRGLRILWIPVSHSLFEETPIGSLQALTDPSKPLSTLSGPELDETLVRIAQRIAEAAGRSY